MHMLTAPRRPTEHAQWAQFLISCLLLVTPGIPYTVHVVNSVNDRTMHHGSNSNGVICCFLLQIAHFKIPKYLDVMDDFPKNATGKVQKFKLRDDFVKKLNTPKW